MIGFAVTELDTECVDGRLLEFNGEVRMKMRRL